MTRRRSVPWLVCLAVTLAALLDFSANWLAAHVLLRSGPFLIPGGTVVFALSLTIYDNLRLC